MTVSAQHPTVYRFCDLNKFVAKLPLDGDLGAIIIIIIDSILEFSIDNNSTFQNRKNPNSIVNKFTYYYYNLRLISHTLVKIKSSIFGTYVKYISILIYIYVVRNNFFFMFFGCCRQQIKRQRQRKRFCSMILKEYELSIQSDIS